MKNFFSRFAEPSSFGGYAFLIQFLKAWKPQYSDVIDTASALAASIAVLKSDKPTLTTPEKTGK